MQKTSKLKTSSYVLVRVSILALLVAALFINKKARAQLEDIISISSSSADSKNFAGINSLMTAINEDDIDGVSFFVKANPKLVNEENVGGATSIHIAARKGNVEIMKILLTSDVNINATDNEKWTPLMRASMAGNGEIVNMLLQKGANILQTNSMGEGAIVHAAMSQCNQCLVYIFEKTKADSVNLINSSNKIILNQQLTSAYSIAQSKQNKESQAILSDFLNFITNFKEVAKENNLENKTENTAPNNVENVEPYHDEVVIIQEIPLTKKGVKKPSKFKLVKGDDLQKKNPLAKKNIVDISKTNNPEVKETETKINETPKVENKNLKFKFVKGPSGQAASAKNAIVKEEIKDDNANKFINKEEAATVVPVENTVSTMPSSPAPAKKDDQINGIIIKGVKVKNVTVEDEEEKTPEVNNENTTFRFVGESEKTPNDKQAKVVESSNATPQNPPAKINYKFIGQTPK